jgi:asparaginyl-tRNA synthetase
MQTIFIKDLAKHKGEEITLKAWVYNLRSSGKIAFLQLRDGTGFTQAIVEEKNLKEKLGEKAGSVWAAVQSITLESSVEITGIVTEHPKHPGEFELHATNVKVIQVSGEFPIGKKEHGPDFLLDLRHLWLRSPRQWAIMRIRSAIYGLIEEWLKGQNFSRFDSPILTPAACEGTTTLFGVDYFDLGQAYLSQSGQLYLEAGIGSLGRVYDFGPVFRAEKSKTRRHLTEFWMMDAEAAFVEHEENMQIQEQLVAFVVQSILKNYGKELEILERDVEPLKKVIAPFYRLTHKEAVEKLHTLGSKIASDDDLGAEDETLLTNQYDKPIFVEKYPAAIKAFYMKRDPEDPTRALCADLLAPEGYGEVIGGSQREDDYETLLSRIKEHNLPVEAFEWYLDLRRYGSVPHSGFGIGLERLVTWICGIKHLRESIPFPRMITRKTP